MKPLAADPAWLLMRTMIRLGGENGHENEAAASRTPPGGRLTGLTAMTARLREPAGALRQILIADQRTAAPDSLVCDLSVPLR